MTQPMNPSGGGFLSRLAATANQAADGWVRDRLDARSRAAEAARRAGRLELSGTFGEHTLELFSNGYVRVQEARQRDAAIERLIAVQFQASRAGRLNPLAEIKNATAKTVTAVHSVGKGLASVTGLDEFFIDPDTTGWQHKAQLVVHTDAAVRRLTNEKNNVVGVRGVNHGDEEFGRTFEARANQILAAVPPQTPLQRPADTPGAGPAITAHLESLAQLRAQGVLTDAEFEAAKRRVLGI